jgi:hypothetical protein
MAFNIQVTNPQRHPNVVPHRIVPVKFARAVIGFADKDAPDLDDRGFVIPDDFCHALGPVVGVTQDKTVRVRVIRDRIEPTTQIFPSVDDDTIASLEHPVPGSALNSADAGGRIGDCIYIHGTATGSSPQETKIKLHFGRADGPVLAELAVQVYPELVIRVEAHAVTINGTAPTTTLANAQNIFRRINRIYGQAGVRFTIPTALRAEAVNGFARAGTVTLTNVADSRNTELQTVLRQNSTAGRLNAYFFAHYFDTVTAQQDQVLGIAFSRDTARANPANPVTGFPGCQAGITFRDTNDIKEAAHTAAHEIGHSLQLEHYDNGQQGNASSDVRQDIWAHRDLMHNFVDLGTATFPANNIFPNSAARTRVGYGRYNDGRVMAGELLGIKKLARIRQSDQVNRLRRAARNQTFAPI